MTTYVTPVACQGRAVELSAAARTDGRKVYRKQILPLGQLDYGGRTLRFDKPFLEQVADAFGRRAFDTVPLQLVDGDNKHNNDPNNTRGLVENVQFVNGVGLFADVALTRKGAELVEEYPELGVSVRLIENHENSRNDRFPVALQHVAATWDPRVNGMSGWEPVDLSRTSPGPVVDLSGSTYARLGRKGRTVPKQFTEEELNAAVADAVAKLTGNTGTPGNGEFVEPTEQEARDLAYEFFGDLGEGDGDVLEDDPEDGLDARELVAASRQASSALELSAQRNDALEAQVLELTAERDAAAYNSERKRWIDAGIPPAVVDLARPALEGKGKTIELSNGGAWDAGQAFREAFAVLSKTGLVDLSRAIGSGHDVSEAHAAKQETDSLTEALAAQMGV